MISLINEDGSFYIDGFAFPGNSGSPVFILTSPAEYKVKFAGIIGSYLPYQEAAISKQTGRTRIIFEENTGLSIVWSVKFLEEIIKSKEFQQQLDKLSKVNLGKVNQVKKSGDTILIKKD